MKLRLTKVEIITSKKDGQRYLKLQGVKDDGSVFSGMCKEGEDTPEVDITPAEMATYTAHDLYFGIGFDGSARLESVKSAGE